MPIDEAPTLATGKRLNELIGRMVIRLPEALAPVSLLIATSTALPDRLGAMFDDSYRSRLPSISADAGKGLGTFEELHGHRNAAALARHLEALTSKFFGTAIDGFLERLVQDRRHHTKELLDFLHRRCADYCQDQGRDSANPVDGWITEKFGYIYAVCALAIRYGILPWTIEDVRWAVAECERGHHEAMANTTVDIDPVTVLREYLAENIGRLVKVPSSEMTREQFEAAAAVWQLDKDNNIIFGIRPPIFRQLFNRVQIINVLKILHGEGFLISDNSGGERDRWESKMPIFGPRDSDRVRMYCIRGDIYPEFPGTKVKADREPGGGAAATDSIGSTPEVTSGGGPEAASAAVTVPAAADLTKDGGRPSDGDTGNLDTTNAGDTSDDDAGQRNNAGGAGGRMDAPEMARVTGDGGRPPDGDTQRPSGPEPATASDAARVAGGGADQPDGAENDTTGGRTSADAARVPGDGDPRPDREIRTPEPEKPPVAPSPASVPGSGADQPDAGIPRPGAAGGPPRTVTTLGKPSSSQTNPYSRPGRPGRWRDHDIE